VAGSLQVHFGERLASALRAARAGHAKASDDFGRAFAGLVDINMARRGGQRMDRLVRALSK
jgi:hypothetical protein